MIEDALELLDALAAHLAKKFRVPWKFIDPLKRFGVSRPMNDRRDPSVPPRIAVSRTSSPARRIASRACSTTSG